LQGKIETRVGIFVLGALAVFFYMGFQIGAFRFDTGKYAPYIMHFKDITGLSRKGEVKIAGVKVGWVESIKLERDHEMRAEVHVMMLREYPLHEDAYAVVRQDGLLGPKYIEVIPGDESLPKLKDGQVLSKPSVAPVSVDQLLHEVQDIATNVKNITSSLYEAVGTGEGRTALKETFENLNMASSRIASFTEVIDRSLARNEQNIDSFFEVGNDIRRVANQLEQDVLPAVRVGVDRIADVFDRDFSRLATKIEATADSFGEASIQARDGLRNISSVAQKIDEGKGLIGKLINEDETYMDLKVAIQGFKNYLAKIDRMQFVFDSHVEGMVRQAENYEWEDSKSYFDIRIYPNEDHFYMLQLANSEKGWVDRRKTSYDYEDLCDNPIDTNQLDLPDWARLFFVFQQNKQKYTRYTFKLGLQFGKVFDRVALRFGLFEGTGGVGVDVDIPLGNEWLRWVTTLEVFDTIGWNRRDDRRPHAKWLNKMYLMRNVYFVFGADDFISKFNASGFFGAGLRFGDDDVKYLFSGLAAAAPAFTS